MNKNAKTIFGWCFASALLIFSLAEGPAAATGVITQLTNNANNEYFSMIHNG